MLSEQSRLEGKQIYLVQLTLVWDTAQAVMQ